MKVIKKDGTIEQFDGQKIVNAVSKSAARAMIELDDTQYHEIVSKVMAIVTERFPEQVHGIIPASAGNTVRFRSSSFVCRDHPRIRGEHDLTVRMKGMQ